MKQYRYDVIKLPTNELVICADGFAASFETFSEAKDYVDSRLEKCENDCEFAIDEVELELDLDYNSAKETGVVERVWPEEQPVYTDEADPAQYIQDEPKEEVVPAEDDNITVEISVPKEEWDGFYETFKDYLDDVAKDVTKDIEEIKKEIDVKPEEYEYTENDGKEYTVAASPVRNWNKRNAESYDIKRMAEELDKLEESAPGFKPLSPERRKEAEELCKKLVITTYDELNEFIRKEMNLDTDWAHTDPERIYFALKDYVEDLGPEFKGGNAEPRKALEYNVDCLGGKFTGNERVNYAKCGIYDSRTYNEKTKEITPVVFAYVAPINVYDWDEVSKDLPEENVLYERLRKLLPSSRIKYFKGKPGDKSYDGSNGWIEISYGEASARLNVTGAEMEKIEDKLRRNVLYYISIREYLKWDK